MFSKVKVTFVQKFNFYFQVIFILKVFKKSENILLFSIQRKAVLVYLAPTEYQFTLLSTNDIFNTLPGIKTLRHGT